jgi:photosynthetic reaction center cytochrome c subunit
MKRMTLNLVAIALLLLSAVVVLVDRGRAESALARQQEKPVEQTRKNIKVLNGLPDSQLVPVMSFMASSLGVECDYCHVVKDNRLVPELDDKPAKQTARRMIRMTFDINKNNRDIFASTGAITCYTCHRGQTSPATLPALPVQLPSPTSRPEAGADEKLPTVDQILDHYVTALGGKAAMEKLKTRVTKGTQTSANGASGSLEIYQTAPNKRLAVLTMPNGVFQTGYDGKVGWSKNPRGQSELQGEQLAQLKVFSDFYSALHLKDLYPEMVVSGKEKIGDASVWVMVSAVSDKRIEKLYFDTQTGLLLRVSGLTLTPLARIPDQMDFADYREVDGVKLPFSITQSAINPTAGWTRRIAEVKHNVPIDDARFNMPTPPAAPTKP